MILGFCLFVHICTQEPTTVLARDGSSINILRTKAGVNGVMDGAVKGENAEFIGNIIK